MLKKFPFAINQITINDSMEDFLRMNNLNPEILDLIKGTQAIKEAKQKPNWTKKSLIDDLTNYYTMQSEKYPDIVFFKLRKAINFFQYGDHDSGIKYLNIAYQKHPNHYLPKLSLAFEYAQIPNVKKVYEVLGVLDDKKNITSIKEVFPNLKEMTKHEYLKFLFVLVCLQHEKAKFYDSIGMDNEKEACIKRVYEFISTMIFIDEKDNITNQIFNFINTNPNYNL